VAVPVADSAPVPVAVPVAEVVPVPVAVPVAELAPVAPVRAPDPEPEPEPEPPAPAPERKPLDEAPQLAEASAIASAESALALARHQVSSRPPREVRPRPVEIPPDAEFNGELLRQVRKSKGLSVAQLADRTRISSRHLENLEADRYDTLPPTVYLRGMLMSVSRELGLDSLRVAKSYLGLVEKQLGKPK